MNDSKIAVRYAKALFDLSLKHNALEDVYENMKVINRLCLMVKVREIIGNPVIKISKKKEIMLELAGKDMHNLTSRFIELMFDQRRGDHLMAASRDFIGLTRRHRGIRQITLTTAIPVNDKTMREVAAATVGDNDSKYEFIGLVDPSIMGGFILRVDDTYIDASVRNRINRFRKEFSLATEDGE
jgi:F-type H+-transporting ATPase subunit delta